MIIFHPFDLLFQYLLINLVFLLITCQTEKYFQQPLLFNHDYKCTENQNKSLNELNNFHLRGTALGGWMVLEPWITPSMFYQFLGASEKWGDDAKFHVAIDSRTFCLALGDEEANRQLKNHWKTWVSEDQIRNLAHIGVETLRLPVGDWMYHPYEPFIGCWDGALEEVDRVLNLCTQYNISVIIDVHAMKGSQNGLDNSGDTSHYKWVGSYSTDGAAYYEHWDIRGGDWVGLFNISTNSYKVNDSHILNSLKVIDIIVDTYKNNPVVIGIEPVNEPWLTIPMDLLREFYWRSYMIVKLKAPHWITILHDSFRLSLDNWGGEFFKYCDNYAVDTHIYQAWAWENTIEWFQEHSCLDGEHLKLMEDNGVPIIVGEWSLATDNCAMWLNGFNDNVPGYPKVQCDRIVCPDPYMGSDQPGAPPDPTRGAQDPFGTGGVSYVEYGMCPLDKKFPNELNVIKDLSYKKLYSFDYLTHGQFFWNFRTEFESRWDYQRAVENGWIPKHWNSPKTQVQIKNSCNNVLNPSSGIFSNSYTILLLLLLIIGAATVTYLLTQNVKLLSNFQGYISIDDIEQELSLIE